MLDDIISVENLLEAWREFLVGKRKRRDVAQFSLRLADNILKLHRDLKTKTYHHGSYHAFRVNDPKPRDIHKATVRDRLLHHAIYRVLYPYYDRAFIFDSYSCRREKGTHRALDRFREYAGTVSRNHTRTCWVLKCDIRKFFASIDHGILKAVLKRNIADENMSWLFGEVIGSFHTLGRPGVGLPLGNLTSQLFVNIYMNEFDQYVKRKLKIRHYIRYTDDFVVLSADREYLENILAIIAEFLSLQLKLSLHPQKIRIQTFASGVDFLGWVHFPNHRTLRTSTKRRMIRRMGSGGDPATKASYEGLLSHGNTYKLKAKLLYTESGLKSRTT